MVQVWEAEKIGWNPVSAVSGNVNIRVQIFNLDRKYLSAKKMFWIFDIERNWEILYYGNMFYLPQKLNTLADTWSSIRLISIILKTNLRLWQKTKRMTMAASIRLVFSRLRLSIRSWLLPRQRQHDGGWMEQGRAGGYMQAWLSLVELLYTDATPPLLCHKEPAFLAFRCFFMVYG